MSSGTVIGLLLNIVLVLTSLAIGFYILMQFISLMIGIIVTFSGWIIGKIWYNKGEK